VRRAIILNDPDRQSYQIIGAHFRRTFEAAGIEVAEWPLPLDRAARRRAAREAAGAVVFHNTIGPLFEPLPGVVNVALPLHEWSRYPAGWIERLNRFDAVWASSRFVARVLRMSGLKAPLSWVPPALDLELPPPKRSWAATRPFRFLACGEAHFRKGFHLLVAGFVEAFPLVGEATLTIKTSPGCSWKSPRRDIVFKTEALPRQRLLGLYRRYDAFVSTSLGEGLGLPVAEAVLAGLPVVANRWSGHADLLAADACYAIPFRLVTQPFSSDPSYYADGQRCAWSDPADIAAALRKVAGETPAAHQRVAKAARRHLSRDFGAAAAARRLRGAWGRIPRH